MVNKEIENFTKDTGCLLWQVTMLFERDCKKVMDKIDGITLTRYFIMMAMYELPPGFNQSDIAEYLNIDRMMVSKVLSELKKIGLVIEKGGSYRRNIVLSTTGISYYEKISLFYKKVSNRFFNELEIPEFKRSLPIAYKKIRNRMVHERNEPHYEL